MHHTHVVSKYPKRIVYMFFSINNQFSDFDEIESNLDSFIYTHSFKMILLFVYKFQIVS